MTDMRAEAFTLATPDEHTIQGTIWLPPGEPLGAVQVFHGLGEHHRRYERFATDATARGYVVVAHDHRGHGEHTELLGHYDARDGWQKLTDDGLKVNDMIGDRWPGLPIALLGHSMGSYIAAFWTMQHGYRLSALVLSASTWPSKLKIIPGQWVSRIESWRLGQRGKSPLLAKLSFGDFNRAFEPARTEFDWLTRDPAEVDAYVEDPLCGGLNTCSLWIALLGGLRAIGSDAALAKIQSDLPILLTGGADDPVGGQKGISELALHYSKSGHTKVTTRIYPEGRHEMLNETNRAEFTTDILDWITEALPAVAGA